MILGFGSQEEKTAIDIINECAEVLTGKEEYNKKQLDKIKSKYSEIEEKYKKMSRNDVPERYSYFYYNYYEMYTGNIIVKFKFHHINRQHPFSPDGWALLQTQWIFTRDEFDGDGIFKQV